MCSLRIFGKTINMKNHDQKFLFQIILIAVIMWLTLFLSTKINGQSVEIAFIDKGYDYQVSADPHGHHILFEGTFLNSGVFKMATAGQEIIIATPRHRYYIEFIPQSDRVYKMVMSELNGRLVITYNGKHYFQEPHEVLEVILP